MEQNKKTKWFMYLEKHFPRRKWGKYYKTIICYMLSVNMGLKPSFMWDFGPGPIIPDVISSFVEDLKNCVLVSNDVVMVSVDDKIFISNVSILFVSLQQNVIIMDVTDKESKWVLCETNEFVMNVKDQIENYLKENSSGGRVTLTMGASDCLPTVFGLLLGYPLVYYFKKNYQTLSLSLLLYEIRCKFKNCHFIENFLMYSFSIPENLVNPYVRSIVNNWFNKLKNVNETELEDFELEQRVEYVNSLNL